MVSSLFEQMSGHPVTETKRPTDFDVNDILEGLKAQGYVVDKSTLYRQIRGLGLSRNCRGYFSAAQAVVLLGWHLRGGSFGSYSQYLASAGQDIYDQFSKQYKEE
jgi:hypothetical protein